MIILLLTELRAIQSGCGGTNSFYQPLLPTKQFGALYSLIRKTSEEKQQVLVNSFAMRWP